MLSDNASQTFWEGKLHISSLKLSPTDSLTPSPPFTLTSGNFVTAGQKGHGAWVRFFYIYI